MNPQYLKPLPESQRVTRASKSPVKKLYDGDDSVNTSKWKFYMKKSMNNLATDLLRNDFDKTYRVDYNLLMRMIEKKIPVPESLRHQKEDLEKYVKHFFDRNTGKIDYKGMVLDVNAFDYKRAMAGDGANPKSAASTTSIATESVDYSPPKGMFDDDYIVLD